MDFINSQALIQPNETPKAYRIRLYKNKDLYGLSNIEIGKLCNEAFDVNWDESAHRKKTQNYLKGYNDAKAKAEERGHIRSRSGYSRGASGLYVRAAYTCRLRCGHRL